MKAIRKTSYLFFTLFATVLLSCNKYIDTTKSKVETKIAEGTFTFYPEKNVLIYRSSVRISKDTEVYSPKSFEVSLPKKLLHYQIFNSTDFYFFYPDKQVVYIQLDLEGNGIGSDTLMNPTKAQVSTLIRKNNFSQSDKYNIDKIELNPTRKQYLIKKGAASILLYNLKDKNESVFLHSLTEFRLLP